MNSIMRIRENSKKDVQSPGIPHKAEKLVLNAGKVGHTSRGIVAGVLGYLFLKTGFTGNANKLSKTDAFGFIENEFGHIVMGLLALGLVAYGVFMIIKAKYSSLGVE